MIDWVGTATRLGYESPTKMWEDLYEGKKLSLVQIQRKLGVSRNVIRHELVKAGIVSRTRGGPNNKKIVITDDLIDEVKKIGITAVAKRLGLDYTTLYKRIYRLRGLRIRDLRRTVEPTESVVEVGGEPPTGDVDQARGGEGTDSVETSSK